MANSNLIANLNSIYATKLEIKEVLNTESDDFTEYPDLIEAAIASGGASGYAYITENGDHDIATYAYVNVNVPQQEVPVVPPGYSYVYGTKEILENGTVDISSYASAYVNVPAPEGWILPSGYAFVTSNGNFDIREFESVNVEVPASEVVSGTYNITENGTFDITTYASAYVSVQGGAAVLGYQTITNNGVAYASTYGLDGFSYVDVQVPQSGSSHSGQSTADAWTIEDAYAYISAFEDTNEHTALDLGFEPVVEGVVASVLPGRNYSSQYPTARFWITRDGSAVAADYSNAILCWNMQSNLAATWTEGIDMQIYPGQHVFVQCTKLQKYLDSNTGNYQMECKNGTAIVRQTSANGQLTISQSGTYDTTSYVSAYVNVQGGGYPETTYSLTGYVLDSTRLLVNNNAVNISNGDYLGLSYSYNLGQEITLPNCVQVYADRFIESMGGNVSNVFWFDDNNTITYTGNTRAFTYTGNITLNGYDPIYTQEKNYWYDQYPQKEIRLSDDDGHDYYITDGDYRQYIDNISSIRGLTANISYITDNYNRKFATINSIIPVQYTGFMYEAFYGDPSSDVNFTSETIDGHTGLSCILALEDPTLTGGELVGGGVVKATLNGSDYFDIQLDGLNIDDGTTLSYEQRYFGKFGTSANLNVGWYDDVHTCESMKLFIYLDDSTWVAKYIWTLN